MAYSQFSRATIEILGLLLSDLGVQLQFSPLFP